MLDLVLLKKIPHSADQPLHHLILPLHHHRQIETRPIHFDAVFSEAVRDVVITLAGIQQRLGRNASDVKTSAAEKFSLHTCSFKSQLSSANGSDISARARADN